MQNLVRYGLLVLLSAAWPAAAQWSPKQPIRLVVPAAAGGGPDVTARFLAQRFSKSLGQQIVIDNRAGANAAIGTDIVAKAPADGHTWLLGTGQITANPSLQKNLGHDVVRDFTPVSLLVANTYFLVVHPSLPARSVKDLIAVARAHPGRLNFGSGGVGSASHLSGEMFKAAAKVNMVHVPYKGASLAVNDLLGGHLEVMFPAIASSLPLIQAGRIRGLAVTSPTRHPAVPQVPTIAEAALPGFSFRSWVGILVPSGTPQDAVRRIHSVIIDTIKQPENQQALIAQGTEPWTSTSPEEFADFIRQEVTRFSQILKQSGVQPQ